MCLVVRLVSDLCGILFSDNQFVDLARHAYFTKYYKLVGLDVVMIERYRRCALLLRLFRLGVGFFFSDNRFCCVSVSVVHLGHHAEMRKEKQGVARKGGKVILAKTQPV